MRQTRLLVLSSGFPYPVDAGRKAVLAGFLDFAVGALGADHVTLLCITPDQYEAESARQAPCRVVFLAPAGAVVRLGLAATMCLLLRRRALQEALVAAPGSWNRIISLLDGFEPDIVLVDTIRMVQHLPEPFQLRCRCVLYLEDLYSLRYVRMIEALKKHPDGGIDPIGTFIRFVPRPLRGLMRGDALQRRLLALESVLLGDRERAMPHLFDQILLLNDKETKLLRASSGASNVTTVMPLSKRRTSRPARSFDGRPNFLFLGNLSYPGNAYGLTLFLRQAMPGLLRLHEDAALLVVGRGAGAALREVARPYGTRVRFLDYVENFDSLASACAAMIIPLPFGTGIKIKAMDALSRGLPLVSTSSGIDGLDLQDGVQCIVRDDVTAFPEGMIRLLDPVLNASMSQAAFAYFDARLSTDVVCAEYRSAILGPDPDPTPPPAAGVPWTEESIELDARRALADQPDRVP